MLSDILLLNNLKILDSIERGNIVNDRFVVTHRGEKSIIMFDLYEEGMCCISDVNFYYDFIKNGSIKIERAKDIINIDYANKESGD